MPTPEATKSAGMNGSHNLATSLRFLPLKFRIAKTRKAAQADDGSLRERKAATAKTDEGRPRAMISSNRLAATQGK